MKRRQRPKLHKSFRPTSETQRVIEQARYKREKATRHAS
jgi:hypothetical protein